MFLNLINVRSNIWPKNDDLLPNLAKIDKVIELDNFDNFCLRFDICYEGVTSIFDLHIVFLYVFIFIFREKSSVRPARASLASRLSKKRSASFIQMVSNGDRTPKPCR